MSKETPKYKGVTWGPVAAILVTIGVYMGGMLLGYLLFVYIYSLYITFKNSGLNNLSDLPDSIAGAISIIERMAESGLPLRTAFQFLQVLAIEAVTFGLLFIFLRYRKAALRTIGLIKPRLQDLGYTVLGFAAYLPIYIVSLTVLTGLIPTLDVNQEQQLGFEHVNTTPELAMVFVSLVLLPPLIEEILCRGFLYSGLKTKLPIIYAALVTSVFFGAAHLQAGSGAPLLWVAAVDTFILSMVLVYLRERSGSLWPPIGVHMLKNGLAFLLVFVLKVS